MLLFTEAFADWRPFDVSFACTTCGLAAAVRVWGRASISQAENITGATEALIRQNAWSDAYVSLAAVRCPQCGTRDPRGLELQRKRLAESRNVVIGVTVFALGLPAVLFLVDQIAIAVACTILLLVLAVFVNRVLARRLPSLEDIDRRVVFHEHAHAHGATASPDARAYAHPQAHA